MNLIYKKVKHEIFGKGNVVNCNDSYIKINFESGTKKFVFPDVFEKYITLIDQEVADLVREKLQEKEEERKKEEIRIQEEWALRQERLNILKQENRVKNRKTGFGLFNLFRV